jgi:hypothetical protein
MDYEFLPDSQRPAATAHAPFARPPPDKRNIDQYRSLLYCNHINIVITIM